MTLLIYSNKDFDWAKTPCLLYFHTVKFHYVKKAHDVSSLMANVGEKCWVFQHKRQRNKSFSRFVGNLKTPTRTWKCARCTMQIWTTRTRQAAFQKLLQSSQTSRNNKKLSKQVSVIINHILANSQIKSIPEYKQFSYRTFLYRTNTKAYAYN